MHFIRSAEWSGYFPGTTKSGNSITVCPDFRNVIETLFKSKFDLTNDKETLELQERENLLKNVNHNTHPVISNKMFYEKVEQVLIPQT